MPASKASRPIAHFELANGTLVLFAGRGAIGLLCRDLPEKAGKAP